MNRKTGFDNIVLAQVAMVIYTIAILGLLMFGLFEVAFGVLGVSYCALKYRSYKRSQQKNAPLIN